MKEWLRNIWEKQEVFLALLRGAVSVLAAMAAARGLISEAIALVVVGAAQAIPAGQMNRVMDVMTNRTHANGDDK